MNPLSFTSFFLFYSLSHLAVGLTDATGGRPPTIVEHPEDLTVVRTGPATLQCRADGDPPVVITWYKDGRPVTTVREVQNSNRVLVSNGLMFLNVDARSDPGTYVCNATNPYGTAISRNATLQLAMIRDEFRAMPESTRVNVDEILMLNCRGPSGRPEPTIRWKKNGEAVIEGGRIQIRDGGSLSIAGVRKADAGTYVCIAENTAGVRESRNALVEVVERPKLVRWPTDESAIEDEDVTLECRASGDPQPVIIWRRADGKVTSSRARSTERGLQITQLREADDGVYICRAENEGGVVEASARLTVLTNPSFTVTPADRSVPIGSAVELACSVSGQPPPSVYWSREGDPSFLFPGQLAADGRFAVTAGGSLEISRVEKADEGVYICHALSSTGRAQARARLIVDGSLVRLPPIIEFGPQNITLPRGAAATLPCSAADSSARRLWYKDGVMVSMQRASILSGGSLQIPDVQPSDAGMYTCALTNSVGTTTWSAQLSVHDFDTSLIAGAGANRTAGQLSLSALPSAPPKPQLADITRETVTLVVQTDAASVGQGSGPLQYRAEYYAPQFIDKTWKSVSKFVPLTRDRYIITGLRPDFTYYFVIRAVNAFGVGAPSPVSEAVCTSEWPEEATTDPSRASTKIKNTQVINLDKDVVEATSAKLSWQVTRNFAYIDTFYVQVSEVRPNGERTAERELVQRTPVSKDSPRASVVIDALRPNTAYEVRIAPGSQSLRGQLSTPVNFRTREAAPTGAPQNVSVVWLSAEQLAVQWLAPPVDLQNGLIVSYRGRLVCLPYGMTGDAVTRDQVALAVATAAPCNDSRLSPFTAESTHITLAGLSKSVRYVLQLAAATRAGVGRYSDPLLIEGDQIILFSLDIPPPATDTQRVVTSRRFQPIASTTSPQDFVSQPWFIAAVVGAAVTIGLVILFVFLYRNRCRVPASSKSYLLPSVATSGDAKTNAVALHPLLQAKGDNNLVVADLIEQQQRAAQKAGILSPNLIGGSVAQQQSIVQAMLPSTYSPDSYGMSGLANNMDVSLSDYGAGSAQLRTFIDAQSGLPAVVSVPMPSSSAASGQSQSVGNYGMQNGMMMNNGIFRPMTMHAAQEMYDSEYAPLLPLQSSQVATVAVGSQSPQRSGPSAKRFGTNQKNGTKQNSMGNSSSGSSTTHLNAANRKAGSGQSPANSNQSHGGPQLLHVNDFLPPPPTAEQLSPNSLADIVSEPEPEASEDRERATSNPLHYQSTTSRGSNSSGAPQPLAAHIEVTPYGPQLMVSLMDSNGQLMSVPWSTAVAAAAAGNPYSYGMSQVTDGETPCMTELEEVTSQEEDDDDDDGTPEETDAYCAENFVNGESDASTTFMLEAGLDSLLKQSAELVAIHSRNGPQSSSTMPMRLQGNPMGSALPQVLEHSTLQQPYAFGLGNNASGPSFAMKLRASSPYSSDNSTYGIVLPSKPGPNLLLPANGQQQPRPPRKRRTFTGGSQKLSPSNGGGKHSPPTQVDMNANSNDQAHGSLNV